MRINNIILIFPVIPVFFVLINLFFRYIFTKDYSHKTVLFSCLLQIFAGSMIIWHFFDFSGILKFSITEFNYSILFSMDRFKIFFIASYLITLVFVIISYKIRESFSTFYLRNIFLFFLAGCSGLLVTGDMFNFYVSYELMIICAYAIIASNGKFYASLKYMFFGTISSLFFLGGVIYFYMAHQTFDFNSEFFYNFPVVGLLFALAFIIKSGIFPISFWVPACHGAAKSLFSVCLSAFPVSVGIYGLFYFVVVPSNTLAYDSILIFIRILAVLTIISSALFIFFEPVLKKAVAWSSVFAMGTIALILSYGQYEIALSYMVVHAFYKGVFFLILDDIEYDRQGVSQLIKSGRTTRIYYVLCVFFAAGIFPTFTHFIKGNFGKHFPGIKFIWIVAAVLITAGFFKFRYKYFKWKKTKDFYVLSFFLGVAVTYIVLKKVPRIRLDSIMVLEFILLFYSYKLAHFLYNKFYILKDFGNHLFYNNLNREFLYVVILFVTGLFMIR
ncbi:MAG: proton-conducting transporter membrane subunit [Candidatus Muiribacteriota bacterium]